MIIIKSKRDGRRRCGIAHTRVPVEYPDDRFTPEEMKRLQADKVLVVSIVAGRDPYDEMTKAQILKKIEKFQPVDMLKKEKKTDLFECLKKHEEQLAKDEAAEKAKTDGPED